MKPRVRTTEHYRQKAHEARQRMERSTDPNVRQMWRAIAQQHEYLAEHVPQREELSGRS
jgi:hypothetical protein